MKSESSPLKSLCAIGAMVLLCGGLCSCSPLLLKPTPVPSPPVPSPTSSPPVPTPVLTPPPPTPIPSPTPVIDDAPAATWGNLGPANLGDSVAVVAEKFGIEFLPIQWLTAADDCGLVRAKDFDIALVIAEPGGVQAFVVSDSRIPVVSGEQPIYVGDSMSSAAASFSDWFAIDDYESLAGGPRGVVVPQELNRGGDSQGRAILFEAGPDDVIQQYRVGVSAYALQVDYCTTPE